MKKIFTKAFALLLTLPAVAQQPSKVNHENPQDRYADWIEFNASNAPNFRENQVFLLDEKRVKSISSNKIEAFFQGKNIFIPVYKGLPDGAKVKEIYVPPSPPSLKPPPIHTCVTSFKHTVPVFNHTFNIKQDTSDETLPPSTELFDDSYELDFKLLDKKFTISDGDFSQCPSQYMTNLKNLLEEYAQEVTHDNPRAEIIALNARRKR